MKLFKSCFSALISCLFVIPLSGQKITAHTEFHGTKATPILNVEDDLYLRFNMGTSFEQLAQERNISTSEKLYGFVKIYFEELELSTGVLALAESKMFSIEEFDLIFSVVMKEFYSVTMDHKNNWGNKDELLVNVIAQPENTMNTWMKAIAARAIEGQIHTTKVELYLSKDARSSEPVGKAICSGTFRVNVKKGTLLSLYGTRIPALYRPTPDNGIVDEVHRKNLGKILWSNQTIAPKTTKNSSFKTSFSPSDEAIYGRVYFPKSLRNIGAGVGADKICAYVVQYYINGKLAGQVNQEVTTTICHKATSLPLMLWSNEDGTELDKLSIEFGKIVEELPTGEHEMRIVLVFEYEENKRKKSLGMANSVIKIKK